jgi:hypothetical protein
MSRKSDTSLSSTCPLCSQSYDPISRRPISEDSCGHTMCLQCFIFNNNQNGCIQCEHAVDNLVDSKKKSTSDDFDDFDENQLFDDWNQSESLSHNETKQTDLDPMNSIYDDETDDGDSDDYDDDDADSQPYQVQWLSDIKDDAAEFSHDHTYSHTKSMFEVFDNVFGLKQVRLIQHTHEIDCFKVIRLMI